MENHEQDSLSLGVCLVVGGSGWTGSNLVAQLIRYRDECQSVDTSFYFDIHSLDIIPPSSPLFQRLHVGEDSFISCDISEAKEVREVISGLRPKTIFHTASVVDLRLNASPLLEQVNIEGTRNLLDALGNLIHHPDLDPDSQIPCFIYTSTFDVVSSKYGIEKATEESPVVDNNPSNHYKRTKILAEKAVRDCASESFLTCALRSGHIYGPGDMLLPRVVASPVAIGPSSAAMSFTFVENLATAHILAALALYKESKEKSKSDDTKIVNGSAFFITDLDTNFHDFYKRFALMDPCKFRIPIVVISMVVYVVELVECLCFLCLGAWYLSHQLQHPVTGITCAIMESGVQCTAVSHRAQRWLAYRHEVQGHLEGVEVTDEVVGTLAERKTLRVVANEEALLRTVEWWGRESIE